MQLTAEWRVSLHVLSDIVLLMEVMKDSWRCMLYRCINHYLLLSIDEVRIPESLPTKVVIIVLFYVLFVCKCVLYYCHRVLTQLQLNISYYIELSFTSTLPYAFMACVVTNTAFTVLSGNLMYCDRQAIGLQTLLVRWQTVGLQTAGALTGNRPLDTAGALTDNRLSYTSGALTDSRSSDCWCFDRQ